MSWAHGVDSKGREIGYAVTTECDEPGCHEIIDRGLDYACGGMHGEGDPDGTCDGYFCYNHQHSIDADGWLQVCARCKANFPEEE